MNIFFFLLISLSASRVFEQPHRHHLVIWNVGQGQWLTYVSDLQCLHFDMGGEFLPWKSLRKFCHKKNNIASLSHWDWDHIGALAKTQQVHSVLAEFCVQLRPLGPASKYKEGLLHFWPACMNNLLVDERLRKWSPANGKDSNSKSHVLQLKDVLIPGDSPATEEKKWSILPWAKSSRILILGHHGSRSSSSETLLKKLPMLRMAIASARWARYKHPHPEVVERLKRHSLPLIRTEDWGNIWLEL